MWGYYSAPDRIRTRDRLFEKQVLWHPSLDTQTRLSYRRMKYRSGESNPHAFRHWVLNPACLPFHQTGINPDHEGPGWVKLGREDSNPQTPGSEPGRYTISLTPQGLPDELRQNHLRTHSSTSIGGRVPAHPTRSAFGLFRMSCRVIRVRLSGPYRLHTAGNCGRWIRTTTSAFRAQSPAVSVFRIGHRGRVRTCTHLIC